MRMGDAMFRSAMSCLRHPSGFSTRLFPWVCVFGFGSIASGQLRTAMEVRSLGTTVAETGLEVELTGVVTFSDPPATAFIQDHTAGTFFRLNGADPPNPGDEVRVRGRTFTGLYLPGIEQSTFEILGHRGLPEPLPATFDDLISGRYHYQRVVVEGILRTLTPDEEGTSLARLALGSRIVEALVEQPVPDGTGWIDSRIRVTGLAAGRINARRQLVAPYLRCRDWSDFTLVREADPPDVVPLISSRQLLNFDVGGQEGHRVRVRGTVLASFPRGDVFLRDEESAIAVRLMPTSPVPLPGDVVEAIGFPEMDRFSASLADAEIVPLESGAPSPEALASSISQLLEGTRDGDLVSVTATLVDHYRADSGEVLLLREGAQTLQALTADLPGDLLPGTQLRVTGICRVESTRGSEYRSTPESVSLRPRSGGDIEILGSPTWWTARRLGMVLIAAVTAMMLSALWIVLLRRQVARKTLALRYRIEHEAALEERQRIAREFHDTLEQELAGLSLRLDAAVTRGADDKLQSLLEGSRGLVSRIQTETRNLVSDLRDTDEVQGNLEAALTDLVNRLPVGVGPEIRLTVGHPISLSALPPRAVHHLKMIANEAVANALKHAGATRIDVILDATDGEVAMRIIDDGRGFDADRETRGQPGHFGCMGIRERCARLGATVSWHSQPGSGTRVEICLPLVPDRAAISA
jgi:signal transduction histidine kinase